MYKDDIAGVTVTLDELLRLRFLAQRIKSFTSQKVRSNQAGTKLSQLYGRGMEFEEVRNYQPGDDIRLINWSMTARTGRPYTKVYREERELPSYLLVDQSISMHFGTHVAFKSVIAARIAALLGWAGLQHGDQVGGIVFNEQSQDFVLPKRQRKTLLKFFSHLSKYSHQDTSKHHDKPQHSLSSALQTLAQRKISGGLLIIISDFSDHSKDVLQQLASLSNKNTIVTCFVYDYLEYNAPLPGIYAVSDGQQQMTIDTYDNTQAKLYQYCFRQRFNSIKKHCQKYNIRFIAVSSQDNLVQKFKFGN